jgi:hypothetical protein
MEKHITVNFLQVIHRSVWKRYHSKFSRYSQLQNITKRKIQLRSLFLPYLPHLPLTGNFLWGKLLELGMSLMRKLKFPSELPSRIAVLLAIRNCLHNIKMEVTVCIPSAWRIGCISCRLPSWATMFWYLNFTLFTVLPLSKTLRGFFSY